VTGASGFIGSHVARRLAERGDEVRLGVLPEAGDESLAGLDCERVRCDMLDRRAVRRALRGVERVFHCAGLTSFDPLNATRLFELNVGGARTVLEECLRAGVERVVLNSSAAALGPAERGGTVDESRLFTAARLGNPYVNSVHEAEVEAMRLAARGLPLVCVNPCVVFGAGDFHLSSTRVVRDFLLGRVQLYVDGAFSMVDVRDVADGMLRADARGSVGERYLLGGRNFTSDRLFADLSRLSGIDPPVKVPARLALASAAALGRRAPLAAWQVRAASHWWTYRSAKARRELGWSARPHEETLEATVAWHLDREHDRIARTRRSQQVQYRMAGAALGAAEGALGLASQLLRRAAAFRPQLPSGT
jgi:dihydroflavonol-4-reductase